MVAERVQRVVLIGAECTGKRTLARALADRLGEPWSGEYVRAHVESLDRPLDESDLEPIARGQLQREDAALEEASRFVFHDTNLLSSILYAEHYFGLRIDWVEEVFARRGYDRYFLCLPDIPWEADPGQRVSADERQQLHGHFEAVLKRHGIPYTEIGGDLERRVSTVLSTLSEEGAGHRQGEGFAAPECANQS